MHINSHAEGFALPLPYPTLGRYESMHGTFQTHSFPSLSHSLLSHRAYLLLRPQSKCSSRYEGRAPGKVGDCRQDVGQWRTNFARERKIGVPEPQFAKCSGKAEQERQRESLQCRRGRVEGLASHTANWLHLAEAL